VTVIDRKAGRAALHELHRARRRHDLQEVDWVDSLYKAYLTAIAAGAAVLYGSGIFGTDQVTPAELADVRRYGPAALGLVVTIAVAFGLRSGSRGGPLALEPPDVNHVLLAPVPRASVLRGAAFRQVRGVVFIGAVFGAVAGNLTAFRLPGERIAWVASGVAFGSLTVLAAWGAALLASGNRVGTRVATLIGVVLVAWDLADLVTNRRTSFGTAFASVALLPISSDTVAIAGAVGAAVVVVALTVAGLARIGGSSIEAAQRRARLVGELRFAATLQDVRTVIVLHRQLALQLPRRRPWFRVGGKRRAAGTGILVCWTRDWQGIARWPGNRLLRQLALGLIAGGALAAVWHGTPALVLVAGIALFLAGLDATEGLAQETDHPLLPASYPVIFGRLLVLHLLAPACLVLLGELAGFAVIAAFSGTATALEVGAMVLVPGALAATAAAATSVVLGMPSTNVRSFGSELGLPEIGTLLVILRQLLPPAIAILAVAPVAVAEGTTHGSPAAGAAATLAVPLLAVAGVVAWLQTRKLGFE
jgi:hypothetical protein